MARPQPDADILVRVVGPGFETGIVMQKQHCVIAPARLEWCLGKHRDQIRAWMLEQGYTATIVQKHQIGRSRGTGTYKQGRR